MTVSADEQWIAQARDRYARSGNWERNAEEIEAALRAQAAELEANRPEMPRCPACATHPEMRTFPRRELLTIDPLMYCGFCYGFWSVGDALSRGVRDAGYNHPAIEAVQGPRRCRACLGHLNDDDICRKCGLALPVLACPECAKPMERFERDGVRLDKCEPCHGTWFDVGEIVTVYKLVPSQSLAMSTVDETAAEGDPPAWWIAANILARVFLPWLPT